jgi:hypothetical protein
MRKTLITLSLLISALFLTSSANAFSITQSNAESYSSNSIKDVAPYIAVIIGLMSDEYNATGKCSTTGTYRMNVKTISQLEKLTNSSFCTVEVTFAGAPEVSGLLANKQLAIYPGVTQQETLDWNSLNAVADIENNPLLTDNIKQGEPISVCSKTQLSSCTYSPAPFTYATAQTKPGI